MSDKTKIEWSDATLNPMRGCQRVSPGCEHCYAEAIATRFSGSGQPYEGLATRVNGHPAWTGAVQLLPEKLDQARRWKRPRRIFLNSMSDLFYERVPTAFIDAVMQTIADTPQHTYQVLTKRPLAAARYFSQASETGATIPHNLWLGVSVESAAYLERIDVLRAIPTHVRFISFEPLLGPIHLPDLAEIHWIIIGGESGPGARPMHPDWARELVSQGKLQGCAVFFKQWGEWGPSYGWDAPSGLMPGSKQQATLNGALLTNWGKRLAGRMIDSRKWNEFPDEAEAP